MFLTCFTYRQANWTPDCSWQGPFGYTAQSTVVSGTFNTGQGITSFTAGSTISLTAFEGFQTSQNYTSLAFSSTVRSGSSYIDTENGQLFTTVTGATTGGSFAYGGGFSVGVLNSTTNAFAWYTSSNTSFWYWSQVAGSTIAITESRSLQGLTSTSSYVYNASVTSQTVYLTYVALTTTPTSTTKTGTPTSTTTTRYTWTIDFGSITQLSSSTLSSSSSASASGTRNSTTVSSTFTTTTGATATIISTSTASTSVKIFSGNAGTVTLTTVSTATTATTGTTVTFSANTTATESIATPSWWGWSYERGTVLLATGNTGTNDLPLWLEKSNWTGSIAGLWNFSTATQTTLWPSQPTAQVNAAGSIQSSAAPATTTTTLLTSGSFTWFGSSTTGVVTAGSSIVVFSESTSSGPITASVPLAQTSGSVTSWANLSTSQSGSILTPINTTTSTYAQTGATSGNYTPDVMTVLISTIGGITTATTYTMTTLVAGYFTTSAASGSLDNILTTTGITTASMQSATTTSSSGTWFLDWSNPIQTVAFTSGLSSTSKTSSNNPFVSTTGTNGFITTTQITITSSFYTFTGQSGGTSNNFTQNQFAAPFLIPTLVTALSTTAGLAFYQPGSVGIWSAIPSQQAFVNTSATSITYQSASISAPSSASSISILALESGAFRSINSISGPIITTSTGLWVIGSAPSTFGSTGTSSTSTNLTQTDTSTTINVKSNSWSGPSVTFTNAVTSTFMESAGFTRATSDTHTESFLGVITQVSGSITKTSNYVSTQTNNAPVTWTQNTTSGTVFQYFPGAGGSCKFNPGPVTLNVSGAAVSLAGNSTTWSTASPAFLQVVIGGSFTTTSSTTSSLAGAGAFSIWTIPGIASVITSPAYSISTCRDRFVPALTSASRFWLTPDPFLLPLQVTAPQPAR